MTTVRASVPLITAREKADLAALPARWRHAALVTATPEHLAALRGPR